MRYTKDIFEILSTGGFISQNSISQQRSHLYDAIEDDFQNYRDYYEGVGFLLEGGNGYYFYLHLRLVSFFGRACHCLARNTIKRGDKRPVTLLFKKNFSFFFGG